MSDHNRISAVLSVFPQVTEAAEKYKIAEPDRESRGLARGIANEKTLFDQTAQRLLLISQPPSPYDDNAWLQQLEKELDAENAAGVLRDLETLTGQLQAVRVELVNAGRAKEVLDKIRGKPLGLVRGPVKNSRTQLQVRLDMVSETNRLLASRLLFGHTLLSRAFQSPNINSICKFLDNISRRAAVTFDMLDRESICRHHESHVVFLQCSMTGEGFSSEQSMETDYVQPLKFIIQPQEAAPVQDTACSFKALASEQDTGSILTLQGWMSLQGANLDRKRRMELALQLSLAVIQLASTPWIDDSWTWDSWAIAAGRNSHRSGMPLLFCRRFNSSGAPSETQPPSSTVWSILSRGPVLARLGLCLVELAFGQRLSEIRRESAAKHHLGEGAGSDNEFDADLLDFITAKQLLSSQRIRHQLGEPFEDAVRACIHQQFRVEKTGVVFELNQQDPSFLQNATLSIISPLWSQLDRYIRAEHHDTVPARKPHHKAHVEGLTARKEHLKLVSYQGVAEPLRLETHIQNKDKPLIEEPEFHKAQASYLQVDQNNKVAAEAEARLRSTHIVPRLLEPILTDRTPAVACCVAGDALNSFPLAVRPAGTEQSEGRAQTLGAGPGSERYGLRLPSPSNESLEDSEWAYGSATETTDSAHAWASNALNDPPELEGAGHPVLSRIRHLVLRVVLHNFQAWNEQSPGPVHGTARGPAPTESRQPKKRGRGQPRRGGGGPDDDDDNDDDDDEEMEEPGARKRQRADESKKTLACPFWMKDSRVNGSCCGKRLTRIRDVKQHLKRRHYMPIYCPICHLSFLDEMTRDNHTYERTCERGSRPRPVGISQKQQAELCKRAPRQLSEAEQWYAIYAVLFPGDPRPHSAYIDTNLLGDAMAFQKFVEVRGIDILRHVLEAGGAVSWNVPVGQDLNIFRRQILGEGLAAISDEWARAGAPSSSAAENSHTGIPSSSEGGLLGVADTEGSSNYPGSAMDADAASSVSAVQTGTNSSIVDSSEYVHNQPEPWWSYGSHQHDSVFDWGVLDILGEDDVSQIQKIVSEGPHPDNPLGWQQHGGQGEHYGGS
ncbi:hypothetical protein EsH8_V_001012 [Colletotrichum jinshuiense]